MTTFESVIFCTGGNVDDAKMSLSFNQYSVYIPTFLSQFHSWRIDYWEVEKRRLYWHFQIGKGTNPNRENGRKTFLTESIREEEMFSHSPTRGLTLTMYIWRPSFRNHQLYCVQFTYLVDLTKATAKKMSEWVCNLRCLDNNIYKPHFSSFFSEKDDVKIGS